MKRYVIVGNGVAAIGCIEGIRTIDGSGEITVVSGEKHPAYCRPLISYYLEKKTDIERMKYRRDGFYDDMGCKVIYGHQAVKLDTAAQTVLLDDGTALPYDELCIAAGSSPFVPDAKGLESVPQVFTFMTEDDAAALEKAVRNGTRVLIVGAGLIGLKCAEGLAALGAEITVCDLAERVLSSILDPECAAMVQKHLKHNSVRFMLGDTAVSYEGNIAHMKSGTDVGFDVLVIAVGVRANTRLVGEAGGSAGRGITVDTHMRTDLPHIWAAGDCTESLDVSDGKVRVMALMPNAYIQGHAAGVNMAGGDDSFDNCIPMNSIGFFGLHCMTAGSCDGEVYEEKTADSIKKLFVREGRLAGFMLIGDTGRAGIYTTLVRERTPLESIDFEILKKFASCAAFSPEKRGKMFGSVV